MGAGKVKNEETRDNEDSQHVDVEMSPYSTEDLLSFFSTDVSAERQLMAMIFEGMLAREYEPHELCSFCDSPPCIALLDRPSDVFSDPAQIPSHISARTMRMSTYQWARTNYQPFIPAELLKKESLHIGGWPLPVGMKSAQRAAELPLPMYWPLPVPFDGEEQAALALSFTSERAKVDVFGLVESVPSTIPFREEWGEAYSVWVAAPAQVRWRGASPYTAPGKELEPLVRAAVRWWERVGAVAFPAPGGRPPKEFDRDAILRAYRAHSVEAEIHDERESKEGLAAVLGTSLKTLNKNLTRLKLDFPPE